MARKSFKDNPALQFINGAGTEERSRKEKPASEEKTITMPHPVEGPPNGYKRNPIYVETKRRRLQLVLQPSLYERVKNGADAVGLSVNEYVHQILDNATREA